MAYPNTSYEGLRTTSPPYPYTLYAIRTVSERFVTAVSSRQSVAQQACAQPPRVCNHISPDAACSSTECAATPQSRQPSGKAVNRYAGHAHTLRCRPARITIIRLQRAVVWLVHPARGRIPPYPLPRLSQSTPGIPPYQNNGNQFIPCPPAE